MKIQPADSCLLDIADEDILKAMKDINGYLDITPRDFKEVYLLAYRHAVERLMQRVTAGDIMTRKVVYVEKDTPLEEVADIMSRHGISGVPVVDKDKKVAGIISEKDFYAEMGGRKEGTFMGIVAQCLKNKGCLAVSLRKQQAQDIMTAPAIAVSESEPVFKVAGIFTEKNINRTPVTDEGGRLSGIVTRSDIVRSSCALPE
ncbi:MAG: CBS domain-containing protein [Thermodesulfobacteriota bacterium]